MNPGDIIGTNYTVDADNKITTFPESTTTENRLNIELTPSDTSGCCECGSPDSSGVTFHNSGSRQFKYMEIDEWAHIECYIDRCVQKTLERLQR